MDYFFEMVIHSSSFILTKYLFITFPIRAIGVFLCEKKVKENKNPYFDYNVD